MSTKLGWTNIAVANLKVFVSAAISARASMCGNGKRIEEGRTSRQGALQKRAGDIDTTFRYGHQRKYWNGALLLYREVVLDLL